MPRSLALPFRALCALLLLVPAFAAAPSGRIAGTVTNQATGDLLAGARVQLEGLVTEAESDRDGAFAVAAPAGPVVVVISFAGLETLRRPVVVPVGAEVRVDATLTAAVYQLERVTVSGLREGQALALQRQSQAENLKSVAAADSFGNPAANPGELLMRLPGVAVNTVSGEAVELFLRGMGTSFIALMSDGNALASSVGTSSSRDFQLTALDTGNIESAEIVRAPTPDLPANAIAGYLNFVTRRGFDRRGRRVELTVGTRWTDFHAGRSPHRDRAGLDQVALSYADVFNAFGGQRNLGVAFNVNHRSAPTLTDAVGGIGAAAAVEVDWR